MERRRFVKHLPVVTTGLAAGLGTLALSACGGVALVVPSVHPRGIAVSRTLLAERGQLLVQSPAMARPVFLHLQDGVPIALLASCTHQGCQPEPVGDRLVCPCHGSAFTLDGEVVNGPAERALVRYDVTPEGARWVVHVDGSSS